MIAIYIWSFHDNLWYLTHVRKAHIKANGWMTGICASRWHVHSIAGHIAMSTPEYLNRFRSRLIKYGWLSIAWTIILNPKRDYPSNRLSIQIEHICIEIVFLTVHIMDINMDSDRKRFRYSGVDRTSVGVYCAVAGWHQVNWLSAYDGHQTLRLLGHTCLYSSVLYMHINRAGVSCSYGV